MSRLTIESGQSIARTNIERLYHFPRSYKAINYYLGRGSLKRTLLGILNYIKDKQIIIDKHRYNFLLDTATLTDKIRKSRASSSTSNRHFNLLCCMGMLNRVYQSSYKNILLDANRNFLKTTGRDTPINVFSIREYTERELDRIEERCQRLMDADVTIGCISYNYLALNGLKDIADEVYFQNNRSAPLKKLNDLEDMMQVLYDLTETYGYATKQMIHEETGVVMYEVEKILRIFKTEISHYYDYKRPSKKQMEELVLDEKKYIFIRKDRNKNEERNEPSIF